MSQPTTLPLDELTVDRDSLYLEEVFTDLRIATIRRLSPMTAEGLPDASRPVLYQGQTQLMSQMGPLPVSCAIEAASLNEAMDKFPEAIAAAVERMVEEAREAQREEASRIIVPGQPSPGGRIKL